MIRPFTCLCFLLACGSGLYLYQSKHEVQLLDRQIKDTVYDTDAIRAQIHVLRAEWTLLNDLERLHQFADQYLNLKPLQPSQFVSLADLDTRLPAPRLPEAQPKPSSVTESPTAEPIQASEPQREGAADQPASVAVEVPLPLPPLRVPPRPAPPVVMSAPPPPPAAHVATERKPPPHPSAAPPADMAASRSLPMQEQRSLLARAADTRVAEPRPIELRPADARPAEARSPESRTVETRPGEIRTGETRPADARPIDPRRMAAASSPPPPAPQSPGPAGFSGSLLGMARSGLAAPAPMPRPTPINAAQWTNGN